MFDITILGRTGVEEHGVCSQLPRPAGQGTGSQTLANFSVKTKHKNLASPFYCLGKGRHASGQNTASWSFIDHIQSSLAFVLIERQSWGSGRVGLLSQRRALTSCFPLSFLKQLLHITGKKFHLLWSTSMEYQRKSPLKL